MEREATKVLSGEEYDNLFPKALLTTIVKKKGATVKDTLKLIPQVVNETMWQTQKIAALLKGKTLEKTCRKIWEFVYRHIAYRKDENGKEQVRSPARTWHDRHNFLTDESGRQVPGGVDCDCGTTFISSILSNLKIRHKLRIVKFADGFGRTNDFYSHIYPIVPKPGGGYYTVDFVVHRFNYEEPFREKHDTNMDLEYLNGVYNSELKSTDAIDLSGAFDDGDAFSDLGKLFKKKSSGGGGGSAPPKKKIQLKQVVKNVVQKAAPVKQVFQKGGVKKVIQNTKQAVKNVNIKQVAKKVLNVANKLNPAVVPLRAGVLAAMKINFMKVAQRLKYSYLSDAEAQRRGIDMDKFQKLKQVRTKLENIFYSAGGKPENLKSAILTGKGNKNRDVVAGLGYVSEDVYGIDQYTPLSQLLGDAYHSERIDGLAGMEGVEGLEGMEGLGELGEPATAAVITAATGALTAIASVLKQIGNIFKNKNRDSQDYAEAEAKENSPEEENSETPQPSNNEASTSERQDSSSSSAEDSGSDYSSSNNSGSYNSSGGSSNSYASSSASSSSNSSQGNYSDSGEEGNEENENNNQDQLPSTSNSSNLPAAREAASSTSPTAPQTFWQKNKTWLLPTSIGSGILLICIGGYMILKKPSENKQKKQDSLSGIPRSRKRKKKGGKGNKKPKIKSKKKKEVAFV